MKSIQLLVEKVNETYITHSIFVLHVYKLFDIELSLTCIIPQSPLRYGDRTAPVRCQILQNRTVAVRFCGHRTVVVKSFWLICLIRRFKTGFWSSYYNRKEKLCIIEGTSESRMLLLKCSFKNLSLLNVAQSLCLWSMRKL